MDRQQLVNLFQTGMKYPPGRHRFWYSRCFEVTVHPGKIVELDEYENFTTENPRKTKKRQETGMFHVGRSVLHLKQGKVIEHCGDGWKKQPEKALDKAER